LVAGEESLLALVLAALAAIPLGEMAQRWWGRGGIPGGLSWLPQLTFLLALLGLAAGARERTLLSMSAVESLAKGWPRDLARWLGCSAGAALCALLAHTSWSYVLGERSNGTELPGGIPHWIVLAAMPVALGLVALRLAWSSSAGARGRAACTGLAASSLWWIARFGPESTGNAWLAAAALIAATALGMPLFAAISGATALCLWSAGFPLESIPLKFHALTTQSSLPAIPLFTMAGYFLARGSSSRRLVTLFRALAGNMRGGPALVVVLVCAFFTTITGASGVTILALGGLIMPMLLGAGYGERTALGLITSSSALGMLLPPCLPLILYAIVANTALAGGDVLSMERRGVTIEHMFLGGVLPGLLLIVLTWLWGLRRSPREARLEAGIGLGRSLWDAKWELGLPPLVLGAIFSGLATPLEASALTALWTFMVVSLRGDLKLGELRKVLAECGALVGGILAILGASLGLTHYLVLEEIPLRAAEWAAQSIHSRWVFLLALNGFLVIVGCLLDVFSAIVVVVPLIVPMGQLFDVDPVHLGIVFLANLELGYLTPPVGLNLFLSAARFGQPFGSVVRSVLPVLAILALGVLAITYLPWLCTALPRLVLESGR
jgi:tripartite ATP-independent transporter DctM subunit